ncbi:hypothetical protein JXI42_01595 [bacterium]|nr:hypothetical protein [bacterium]
MKKAGLEHWASPNTGATNESGFTALPAGYRYLGGVFHGMTDYARFWASSEYSTSHAWYRYLGYSYTDVVRDFHLKEYGLSVRCLRD